ncbi:MAG: hypothetical protein EOS59_32585 [Mesorhizobium sp.]|nr:MAG: hypothetical protein EOS59_32585 [Mesorhizobium sp.]
MPALVGSKNPRAGARSWFTICMTLPPTDWLEALSLAQLHGLVAALLGEVSGLQGRVERLEIGNQALRAENQTVKDEIARLKNLPLHPPGQADQAVGQGEGHSRHLARGASATAVA